MIGNTIIVKFVMNDFIVCLLIYLLILIVIAYVAYQVEQNKYKEIQELVVNLDNNHIKIKIS